MPEGTDTVVMQEHIEINGENILIDDAHQAGQNVRQAGEDIPIGGQVLSKGQMLTPADLGLLCLCWKKRGKCSLNITCCISSQLVMNYAQWAVNLMSDKFMIVIATLCMECLRA